MKVEIKKHIITKINFEDDELDNQTQVEEIFFAILSRIFLDKSALLITITPQKKYSIGYEIAPYKEAKIETSNFLVNDIKSCSSLLLKDIIRSEEFGRGLLLLMKKEDDLFKNLDDDLRYIHNGLGKENLSHEFVMCENDGKTLSLYNSDLPEDVIPPIISSLGMQKIQTKKRE